jgi:hypothetical protein
VFLCPMKKKSVKFEIIPQFVLHCARLLALLRCPIVRPALFICPDNLGAHSKWHRTKLHNFRIDCPVHISETLVIKKNCFMRDLKLQPRFKGDLRSFGLLRSIEWQFRTDVSGQPLNPFFKCKSLQKDRSNVENCTIRLSQNVGN